MLAVPYKNNWKYKAKTDYTEQQNIWFNMVALCTSTAVLILYGLCSLVIDPDHKASWNLA